MTVEIKIDHNIKPPKFGKYRKYPWNEMKKGDSFFSTQPYLNGPARAAAVRIGNGCKFICRSVTENGVKGVRVWRVS